MKPSIHSHYMLPVQLWAKYKFEKGPHKGYIVYMSCNRKEPRAVLGVRSDTFHIPKMEIQVNIRQKYTVMYLLFEIAK